MVALIISKYNLGWSRKLTTDYINYSSVLSSNHKLSSVAWDLKQKFRCSTASGLIY